MVKLMMKAYEYQTSGERCSPRPTPTPKLPPNIHRTELPPNTLRTPSFNIHHYLASQFSDANVNLPKLDGAPSRVATQAVSSGGGNGGGVLGIAALGHAIKLIAAASGRITLCQIL